MKFQRNDIPLLAQLVLLALTPVAFSICLGYEELVITRLSLILVWVIQAIILFRYLRKSEVKLRQAIRVINSGEDYQVFRKKERAGVHDEILGEINEAISRFRKLKTEREADLLFFQLVMEYVPVGIIVTSGDESIRLVNRSAMELIGINNLENLSRLNRVQKGLADRLRKIPENNNILIELELPGKSVGLSVSARETKVMDVVHRIYSFKDIKKEVDRKELETWHNMLRIISHEVVNSVSPITLSSRGMLRNLREIKELLPFDEGSASLLEEMEKGLQAISGRGEGLNQFVEKVQKLTRIPDPVPGIVTFKSLITESAGLMQNQLDRKNIRLITSNEDIYIYCDKALVVQVLINLIRNSMESFNEESDKKIFLSAGENEGFALVKVEDNGPGIPGDLKNQVFSPFFSTKKRGSGLGLSFARQVMKLHCGEISVSSEKGKTIFSLSFPDNGGVRISDTGV